MQLYHGKVVMKDHSSNDGMMMNDDEEPNNLCWKEKSWAWSRTRGRGGWKAISFHGVPAVLISERKKKNAVLISGSNQVFIVVFLISASNKVLYRRLHDVRDAASTPGLMSFDPASVDVVARNFCPLRRCPTSFLGETTMLYPNKWEKCNWRNEGITIVKQELEVQLERWDGGNASGEETKQIMWFDQGKHCGGLWCQRCSLL